VLLEPEPDTERRENVSAARFTDTESHPAGVGLTRTNRMLAPQSQSGMWRWAYKAW
jgi:hypothetical protein